MSFSRGKERVIRLTEATNEADRDHEMKLNFPSFMHFNKEEISLNKLFMFYSWFNITAAYGNNTVSYLWQDDSKTNTQYDITFPDGFYTYEDISGYIQLKMSDNKHYLLDANGNKVYYLALATNVVYYGVTLTATVVPAVLPTGYTNPEAIYLSGKTPQLKVSNQLFANVIGFALASFPASPSATTYQINNTVLPVLTKVNVVNVTCNLVNSIGINQDYSTIYTFSPESSYSNLLREDPQQATYYPIMDGNYDSITIGFYNEDMIPIAIVDPNITVVLKSRPIGSRD